MGIGTDVDPTMEGLGHRYYAIRADDSEHTQPHRRLAVAVDGAFKGQSWFVFVFTNLEAGADPRYVPAGDFAAVVFSTLGVVVTNDVAQHRHCHDGLVWVGHAVDDWPEAIWLFELTRCRLDGHSDLAIRDFVCYSVEYFFVGEVSEDGGAKAEF